MAKLLSNTRVYGTATIDTLLYVNGANSSHSTATGSLRIIGGLGASGGAFFGGTVTATNFVGAVSGTASLANDIAGGTAGQLLYQISPNDTGFVGPGTAGQILISAGTSAPTYVNTTTFVVGISKNLLGGAANQFAYQTAAHTTNFISTGSMYVGRATLADTVLGGTVNTATNLANGTAGQVPYQTAPGITAFYGPGTAGQLLVSNGAAAPVYTNTASIYVGNAVTSTHLRGGSAGQLPYQTGVGTTSFTGPGTAGQVLTSGGTGAPVYVNTSSLYVGRAVVADSATSTGAADQVKTVAQTSNAIYYPIFVDSNNASATAENLFTTSSFVVNPSTGNVGINTASPSYKLDIPTNGIAIRLQPITSGSNTQLRFDSRVNAGSDCGFLLFQDESAFCVGSGSEDVRFTLGVFNDFRQSSAHSDELWLQGGGRLVYNVGSWDSELNSIIGTPGAGTTGGFEWRINNTVNAILTHGGNFGVGTDSPGEKLHVLGTTADTRIRISADDGTNFRGLDIRAGTTFKGGMFYRSTEGNVMQIWGPSLSSAGIYIDSSNNVGVGTASPQKTLHVSGTARVTSLSEFESRVYMGPIAYQRNSANAIQEWGGASASYQLNIQDGTGRVNYYWNSNGTTVPTQTVANEDAFKLLLSVDSPALYFYGWEGSSSAAGTAITWSEIFRASMGEANAYFKGSLIPIGSGTANYVTKFTAAGTIGNSQIFDNGTNIGIGTASPYSRLTLVTDTNTNGASFFTSAYVAAQTWGTRAWKNDIGGGIPLQIETQSLSTWYTSLRISHGQSSSHPSLRSFYETQLATDGGNVGINSTAPLAKLHVVQSTPTSIGSAPSATTAIFDAASENYLWFRNTADNASYSGLVFQDNNVGGYLVFRNAGVAVGSGGDCLIYGTYQDHIFQAGTSGTINGKTEIVRFKQNGDVGIGTSGPGYKLDVSGTARATSDFRAPIFYDTDNTAYYVDAASTSVLNQINLPQNPVGTTYGNGVAANPPSMIFQRVGDNDGWRIYGEAAATNQVRMVFELVDDIEAAYTDQWVFRNKLTYGAYTARNEFQVSGSGDALARTSMRAPIFYDSDNTAYYVDPSSTTNSMNMAGSVRQATYNKPGILTVASGSASTGGSIAIQQETAEGWTALFADYEPYTGWGLWHDNPNNYFSFTAEAATGSIRSFSVPSRVSGNRTAYEKLRIDQNNGDIIVGRDGYAQTSYRAPIFYDSANTAYFLNLDSSGSLIRGRVNVTGGHGVSSIRLYLDPAENGASTGLVTLQMWCSEPGNTWDGAGFGYNVDNNANEAGNVPAYYFARTNTSFGQAYMRMTTDGNWYFYNNPSGSNTRYLTLQLERTGYAIAPQSMRSPIFYDSANTAYYVDPASTSLLNVVYWGDSFSRTDTKNDAGAAGSKSGFFQTSSPTNYYAGASSWQHMIESRHSNDGNNYSMQIAGSFFDQNFYGRKTNNSSTTAWFKFLTSATTGDSVQFGSFGVGTAASGTTGEIRATNEITAYYSDRRLKENVSPIGNALEKILALTGITYTPNDLAASFGYDKNKKLVGLFADEVEAVLPEAVRSAPFDTDKDGNSISGENYKTIQYEKLVPLLIEAIKEQQKEIDQLKSRLN